MTAYTFTFNLPYVNSIIRNHLHLLAVLSGALLLYVFLPLQRQATEPYHYAAGIEQYYRISMGFSLAQGDFLPDFGRYHPNHPLGHVIAGWAYDWLRIPALAWMRFINTAAVFFTAVFFYLMLLHLRFSNKLAAVTVGSFLSTYCCLLAVFSGEWHMPAMALSFAGFWQIFLYIDEGERRQLYRAALLFGLGSSYHLSVFFYLFPIGVVLLFVRPLKDRWRELFVAGSIIVLLLCVVYIAIPFYLFKFKSIHDFYRTFFVYKYITHIMYSGFDWLHVAGRTIFHTVLYTPAQLKNVTLYVAFFFLVLAIAMWRYFQSAVNGPIKALILLMPIWWIFGYWLFKARPDALLGWLLVLPFVCLMIVKALADLHRLAIVGVTGLTVLVLGWNLALGILPNSLSKRENIFYFSLPPGTASNTPIAFVTGHLLFMEAEIWYAGSELGYRNQMHFMPCCGENDYYSRLKRWVKEHPGTVIVTDDRQDVIEGLFQTQGLRYKRWSDHKGDWPSSLIPSTLYVQHLIPKFYPRRLTVWVPEQLLQY